MHLTHWDYLLWVSGGVGYLALAAVLVIKRRYQAFPWFSSLLAAEILESVTLTTACSPHHPLRYFYTYWAGEILNAVLVAAVIFEVARKFSREAGLSEPSLLRDLRIITWTLPTLTSIAVVFFRFLPDLHHELANLAFKIDTVCAIMMLGLLGTVSLSMYFYGFRFMVHAAAVGYGLLFYAIGRVLVFAAALNTADADLWLEFERWLKPLYILILFIWCVIFWFEEPKQRFSGEIERILSLNKMTPPANQPVQPCSRA